jgi:hypothetical protein
LQTELEALQALRIADQHLIARSNFRILEQEIIKYHSNTLITGKLLCFNIYGYCMELYYKITPEMYEQMEKGDYVVEFIVVGQTPYYQLLSEIIK